MSKATVTCKANIGSRKAPKLCGQPIADGQLATCQTHGTVLVRKEVQIYTRGGSYVVVRTYRGKQHKSFHRTLAEAREARGDSTGSVKKAPAERAPFDEYAAKWIETYQGRTARGFDSDTRDAYRQALERYAVPHFGRTPIKDIGRDDVVKLVEAMQRDGLTAASIAKYVAPLRALFGDLVEAGKLPSNPAAALRINAKVGAAADDDEDARVLTRAELAAVLGAIPEPQRLIFEVMAGTGARISEVLGLEWRDLDGSRLTIRRQYYRGKVKTTKTKAGRRTVDLSPDLAAKLWALGADASGPMFTTRTGGYLSDRNLRRTLDRAAESVGVEGVSHHTFRHTHGSVLLDAGWTLPEVSARLGHAGVHVTAAVYSHKMADRERDLGFLDQPQVPFAQPFAQSPPEAVNL